MTWKFDVKYCYHLYVMGNPSIKIWNNGSFNINVNIRKVLVVFSQNCSCGWLLQISQQNTICPMCNTNEKESND